MDELAKEYLRKFDRFKPDDIDQIIAHTSVETFKKGDFIVREGKICDKCYFILKGCLRQFKVVNGEERTTNFFIEGDPVVLYSSYLNGKPVDCTIQCIENSILISGTKAQEIAMHRANPSTVNI